MGFDIVKSSEQIGCKDKSITKTKEDHLNTSLNIIQALYFLFALKVCRINLKSIVYKRTQRPC